MPGTPATAPDRENRAPRPRAAVRLPPWQRRSGPPRDRKRPGRSGHPGGPDRAGRPPRARGAGGWRWLRLLRLVPVLVVAGAVVNFLAPPWVFHIGDRFTPATMWDGYGTVHASDGGNYVLYAHLQGGLNVSRYGPGGCDDVSGCSNLRGSARMCTQRGAMYSFALRGVVSTWWSTDGAPASITLQPSPLRSMPAGFVFVFAGIWRGPVLPVANRDNSFTEVFAPDGAIRWTTSTRDAGTAAVALHAGTAAAFAHACHALRGA